MRRLEDELDRLAHDPELLTDLMKLKRTTEDKEVDVQHDLARMTMLNQSGDMSNATMNKSMQMVESAVELNARSIDGAITNAKMQNYYQ